jgi:GAF domain-containing protein
VDENLTLAKVQEELEFYRQLALFFHQSGMSVYIRDSLSGNPRTIREAAVRPKPRPYEPGEEPYRHLDQMRLRERLLSRSWSIRGNKKLLELLVEMIPKALEVERCSIFIHDPGADKVWLQTGTGVDEKQIELDGSDSLVGQVIATGKYMVEEDMDQVEGPHKQVDAQTGFVTRNELCVPIKSLSDHKASGAILVLNKKEGQYFGDEDRAFLERVASHLQTAIESIFLRQELIDFSELLTDRARISEWVKYGLWALLAVAGAEAVIIAYLLD